MKNLTIALDDETYRAVRVAAAKRGLSASALVRSLLTAVEASPGEYEERASRLFAVMDASQAEYSAASRQPREQLYDRQG